jgi:hypothetical protein
MKDEERMKNLFVDYCDVVGAALVRSHRTTQPPSPSLPHETGDDPFTPLDLAEMKRLYRRWLRFYCRVMALENPEASRATLEALGRELFTAALRRFLRSNASLRGLDQET